MYTLFLDKQEKFEADIQIEGADASTAKCRLVIETPTINLSCEGIVSNNKCSISIPKLNLFLKENLVGNIKLEVFVEDNFFVPWESQYQTQLSKKVTAEVRQIEVASKPIITAKVT